MRVLALIVALLPLQVQAAEIVLTGPPIWESAPLIALAESQPVDDVTFIFRPWGSPEELRKTIMSDQPAMAVAPSPTASIFAASGIGLRVMSATVTEGSISIVGRGAPVARLGDLEGASLALPFKGYLPDLMMRRIAQPGSESWQPHYTGNPVAGMQLLIAGRVDTALLAEPMATLALTQDAALGRKADLCTLWRDATELTDCPPAGVVVVNDAFENNPQIRGAYLAAFHALAANPGNAADLLSLHFPHMARARAGFSRIRALDLPIPERQGVLAAFFAEIMSIEPAAIGGALPGPDFYGR